MYSQFSQSFATDQRPIHFDMRKVKNRFHRNHDAASLEIKTEQDRIEPQYVNDVYAVYEMKRTFTHILFNFCFDSVTKSMPIE